MELLQDVDEVVSHVEQHVVGRLEEEDALSGPPARAGAAGRPGGRPGARNGRGGRGGGSDGSATGTGVRRRLAGGVAGDEDRWLERQEPGGQEGRRGPQTEAGVG